MFSNNRLYCTASCNVIGDALSSMAFSPMAQLEHVARVILRACVCQNINWPLHLPAELDNFIAWSGLGYKIMLRILLPSCFM